MKRAKEYAAQYRNEPTDKTLAKIATAFFSEVADLMETRCPEKRPSHGAVTAILDEQDRKWRAFAEYFPGIIRPDGFELLLKKNNPDGYALWRGPLAKTAKDYFAATERRRR